MNGATITTAANIEWMTLMTVGVVAMIALYHRTTGGERTLVLGMFLLVTATQIHAIYWVIGSLAKAHGVDLGLRSSYWAIKLWVVQQAVVGLTLILKPLLKRWFGGRCWWVPVATLSVAAFVFGLWAHVSLS